MNMTDKISTNPTSQPTSSSSSSSGTHMYSSTTVKRESDLVFPNATEPHTVFNTFSQLGPAPWTHGLKQSVPVYKENNFAHWECMIKSVLPDT
jgi:hypothetical protein